MRLMSLSIDGSLAESGRAIEAQELCQTPGWEKKS